MSPTDLFDDQVHAVRHFNRFYTRQIGVLEPYLGSDLSLTEVRVLYEIAHNESITSLDLVQTLGIDRVYIDRILDSLSASGWLVQHRTADKPSPVLSLTPAGSTVYAPLQQQSHAEAGIMISSLSTSDRKRLIDAMTTVENLLNPGNVKPYVDGANPPDSTPLSAPVRNVVIRDILPGDLGWIVQQHGEVYAKEYGWDSTFEALVADIVAQFARTVDPSCERGWIAELDGKRVGAILLVRAEPTIAKIRVLVLSPEARGLGLGKRLTDEAISFARIKGYLKIVLWTHSCLTAARAIYAQRGFIMTNSEPYEAFGKPLVSETWEMTLVGSEGNAQPASK